MHSDNFGVTGVDGGAVQEMGLGRGPGTKLECLVENASSLEGWVFAQFSTCCCLAFFSLG